MYRHVTFARPPLSFLVVAGVAVLLITAISSQARGDGLTTPPPSMGIADDDGAAAPPALPTMADRLDLPRGPDASPLPERAYTSRLSSVLILLMQFLFPEMPDPYSLEEPLPGQPQ
jgi:hypothetical protein